MRVVGPSCPVGAPIAASPGTLPHCVFIHTVQFHVKTLGIPLVLRETVAVALIGLAIGVPIAFASSRVLRGLLFGVEPTDPATFAVSSVLLVTATLAASYLPARRASRIDATEALRYE